MRINGTWRAGDDGVVRPIMLGKIWATNNLVCMLRSPHRYLIEKG